MPKKRSFFEHKKHCGGFSHMSGSIKVILSEEAAKQYEELNRIVGDEIKKGITNSIF